MRTSHALLAAAATAIVSWTATDIAAGPAQPVEAFERLYLCSAEDYPLRRFVLQVDDSTRRAQMFPVRERGEMPAGLRAGTLDLKEESWPRGALAVLVMEKTRFVCKTTSDD